MTGRRWTIRWRVVTAATAVAAAGLAAAAWLLVEATERALLHDARADARLVAADVAERLARGDGGQVALELVPGAAFVVRDPDGQVVASGGTEPAGGPPVLAVPAGRIAAHGEPGGTVDGSVAATARSPRFVDAATVVGVDGAQYTITATVPTAPIQRSLRTLRSVLSVGVPGMVGAIGLLTWWLTGRALAPVARLTERARGIAGPGAGERLPVPAADDEVARLARTLNGMLDRLDASAIRSRRFVSDASHELRSPITTIRTLVESGLRRPGDTDWEATAREVLAEDERLERLVGDLLTLARHDESPALAHRPVDLGALVAEEAGRKRRVPVRCPDAGPVVLAGSAERLGHLVRHLLDNAARHARREVTVTASGGDPVVLAVTDDGPGVPPADRERIFDRFARLDEGRGRDAGGFGLGLAVARAVADEHGASIVVADAAGGGARFEVRFPAPTARA